MTLPQLRLRSEFSFRSAYGSVEQVANAAAASGATHAGLVDASGTWGHVPWEAAALKAGIEPLFGAEFYLTNEAGRKIAYWALAKELPAFYRFSSDPPRTEKEIAERKAGLIVFSGAALTSPDAFDYIDINPRSAMRSAHALALAKRTGGKIVVTSDCDYPAPTDRLRFLAWTDSLRMTPQHILTADELRAALPLSCPAFDRAVKNTQEAAELAAGCRMRKAPIISVRGNLRALTLKGKTDRLRRGHIKEWTQVYEDRLQRELAMIKEKKFESYFLVVADMIAWAKDHMLVGPGRGSSAGSLVCYCLRITEIDPLVHDLVFERFIDVNRADLPDIDSDFNDQKREQVFEYLAKKYKQENTSRIGSVNRLKPRSVIMHVGKALRIPVGATFPVINVLIEHSSGDERYGKGLEDTFLNTGPGRDFMERYPEASLMGELEEHASHSGVHAAGFIVSNEPITEYCTVRDGVAQIDKHDAETLGLLKMDILGLRTLGVIEDAHCITSQELYDLPLNDPEVFRVFNDRKYSCIFQFEGRAQRKVSKAVRVDSFKQIDHITALARPGPLGGGATDTYVYRAMGVKPIEYKHSSMEQYLGETLGVVLYQEQVMRIVKELGDFTWGQATDVRHAMSKRKGKESFEKMFEQFAKGSERHGINRELAAAIWAEIVNFGAWGMNKSHTVSYAVVSYWCAYLKRYHQLEYAAACLRNAKDEEQTVELLRELRAEGIEYSPFDIEHSKLDWIVSDGRLIGGFRNLKGVGPVKGKYYAECERPFSEKDKKAIAKCPPKFIDLSPAHSLWGDMYKHPENYNIITRLSQIGELEDGEEAAIICQPLSIDRRDENEALLVGKRGYAKKDQTLFLDMHVVDDSISKPILMRVYSRQWDSIGERLADRAIARKDWFLVRGKWNELYSMFSIEKIRCLTNKEIFQ